jgi:hypothetical protein
MLRADPSKRRQLSLPTPDILWRDGQTEREGLVVGAFACADPACPCREIELEVYRVREWLAGVQLVKGKVDLKLGAGAPGHEEPPENVTPVLRAELDIDTGLLGFAEGVQAGRRDEFALAWLREEMDGAFLDHLADKVLLTKKLRPLTRMKVLGFRPGTMVGFGEAFMTGRVDSYALDVRHFDVLDVYCVDPSCDCADMRFNVFRNGHDLGYLIVDLGAPGWSLQHEGDPGLEQVREALTSRYPDPRPFRERAKLMKEAGPDIMASARQAPVIAAPSVGRNQPCPCGSGKKYKRCCLGKVSSKDSSDV